MIGAQQDFSYMDDRALQTALQFAQRSNNTPTFLALMAEANKRKQMRQEAQGLQAGAQAAKRPGTVADQVMQGIANLDSGDHQYAAGGIVSFASGGEAGDDSAQRTADREALLDGLRKLGAGAMDVLTLPARGVAGAAESVITRPLRAVGVPLPYLPEDYYGGDRTSMTPYMDKIRRAEAKGLAPVPAYVDREGRRTPQEAPASTPAPAPTPATRPAPGGIATLATSSKTSKADVGAPPEATTALEKTMTPEELAAKARAMAKGDDDKVAAIYAKAAERDAKRREALDAETKGTKGWLGAEMSPETRKMLRDAGIAMLTSKRSDALGGIGEGLAAASKGYEEGKQRRQDRLDALDAADEKRQLAQIAAQQGNMELSRKYITEAETLKQQAIGNALKKDEAALDRWYKQQHIATQQQANRISSANAGRNPMLELVRALGGGDVNKGWDVYNTGKAVARPLDRAAALKQFQTGLANGTIPAGTDFDTYYKMASGADGAGSAPSAGWGTATIKN